MTPSRTATPINIAARFKVKNVFTKTLLKKGIFKIHIVAEYHIKLEDINSSQCYLTYSKSLYIKRVNKYVQTILKDIGKEKQHIVCL